MTNQRWLPWVSVGSTFAVVFLLSVGVIGLIEKAKHRTQAQIAQIEPRYARLLGLSTAGTQVQELLKTQQQQAAEVLYSTAEGIDRVGAGIQQKLRDTTSAAGLNITGSQVLPPRTEEKQPFKIIEVNLSVAGNLTQLRAALQAVEAIRPRVSVTSLQIFPQRAGNQTDPDQKINAAIRFAALFVVNP